MIQDAIEGPFFHGKQGKGQHMLETQHYPKTLHDDGVFCVRTQLALMGVFAKEAKDAINPQD